MRLPDFARRSGRRSESAHSTLCNNQRPLSVRGTINGTLGLIGVGLSAFLTTSIPNDTAFGRHSTWPSTTSEVAVKANDPSPVPRFGSFRTSGAKDVRYALVTHAEGPTDCRNACFLRSHTADKGSTYSPARAHRAAKGST